jgi:hypothetical protein
LKPVFIIAIAVVCSVVAVLGVLVGLDQIATMQAQQAYDEYQIEQQAKHEEEQIKYNENRELCLTLFPQNQGSDYLGCLSYGVDEALLYLCTEQTGLDRINCIRILQEESEKFENRINP